MRQGTFFQFYKQQISPHASSPLFGMCVHVEYFAVRCMYTW